MICIFSVPQDNTTTEVIKWLKMLGERDILRVNYKDDAPENSYFLTVRDSEICIASNERWIPLSNIKVVWYRKGKNWLCDNIQYVKHQENLRLSNYLNKKLEDESLRLSEYIHYVISTSCYSLGSPFNGNLNKLIVLRLAREVGLLTPDFVVSSSKQTLANEMKDGQKYITKSISDGVYFFDKAETYRNYITYTEQIDLDDIAVLKEKCSPSFIQRTIEKKYEIRVFFLSGNCYSMAIHSQRDKQTQTDYRRYNDSKPNRFTPYNLPSSIESKIKELFDRLELNTGSADLIQDVHNNCYFLEINPVGQFGMVSGPCNYYLEKKVAEHLQEQNK